MRKIVVAGSGKIGATIADILAVSGDYQVTIVDRSAEQLENAELSAAVDRRELDIENEAALRTILEGAYAVLSAAPFHLTTRIAEAAARANVHYLDLTEDVASTRRVRDLAASARSAFIPQCGLAPGFISIVANDLAQQFDSLDSIRMRVGALPQYPSNALNYNLTWSTDGVINEYCEPCEAIVDGHRVEVPAMEEREEFSLDGVTYEAFNTSGGLGTLTETLAGKVRNMSYKTLRYPGHAEIMKLLLRDLELADDRETMRRILSHSAPFTRKDVVVIFVTGVGERNGRLEEESVVLRYDGNDELGAIQLTTASGCVAMIELFLAGKLPAKGFVRQEDAVLADFLATKAGTRLVREARGADATALGHTLAIKAAA